MERDRRSIAVAQTCPVRGDVDANLEEHLRLADCAAAEGALVYAGLQGASGSYEVRWLKEPSQAVAELSIRAAP